MDANTYFQFPLCALSFGQTVKARLNAIMDYSAAAVGFRLLGKIPARRQGGVVHETLRAGNTPEGFYVKDSLHCAVLYGARVIGITYKDFWSLTETYDQLRGHIAEFQRLYGRDALVRIKRDWLFNARDGRGLTYREFCVLCAIYSAIGNKQLATITQERIRHCALGYRTKKIMEAELGKRTDGAQPLTKRQLRDTIHRLHRNRFFARCTVGRRRTYYSIRLDDKALRNSILERYTYPAFFHADQSAKDHALTLAINEKRREAFKS